jgi:hypothetical protein
LRSVDDRGARYYEKGEATNAITAYLKAINSFSIDAQLNLASPALAGEAQKAIEAAGSIQLDHNSATAYYVKVAPARLDQAEPAVQAFRARRSTLR